MATYAEIAPLISGTGITKTAVETYFSNLPEPMQAPEPPAITKAKVQALANKVYDGLDGIAKHGGMVTIAREIGLSPSQVKQLINEMNMLKAAWDLKNNPPE